MAQIPQYTRGIIRQRATPQLADEGAINRSTQLARGVAQVANMGAKIADAHAIANDTTAVNDALIEQRKQKLLYIDKVRSEQAGNPFGFSKRIELELSKIDDMFAQTLPSNRAKKAFYKTAKEQNLGYFEKNLHWENQRSAQIYAERSEKAAQTIADTAYLAGKTGGGINDILKDVAATTVSVGTYQPNPETLHKVNDRISTKAIMSYLQGKSESDPVGGLAELESGVFDKRLGAEKSFKLKTAFAEQTISELMKEDPEQVLKVIDGNTYSKYFKASEINSIRKQAKQAIENAEAKRESIFTSKSADILLRVSNGEITAPEIEADESLSEQDKTIAKSILVGNDDVIQQINKSAEKADAGFEDVDSYSIQQRREAIVSKFGQSEQGAKDIKEATSALNTLKVEATAARQFNSGNKGKGLNKREYDAVLKQIKSDAETLYDVGADKQIGTVSGYLFGSNGFSDLFKEIDKLPTDKATKAELIGYATEIADIQNIDIYASSHPAKSAELIKPIMDELKMYNRKKLGIPDSAPKTKTVIKDGKKIDTGIDTEAKADRSVNPTLVRRRYNEATGEFE